MPRTLAQNAQYIANTIKPAIKAAIEAQGVTVPSTDSFLDYADRIGEIEGGGSGYQLKDLPTGAISTVSDAEPLPLNALKVSVDAVQDLHGYDHPWVGGAGKNKLPMTMDGIKAANTHGTWSENTCTYNGVSFEVQTDNGGNVTGIKVNGTASANADMYLTGYYGSTRAAIVSGEYKANLSGIVQGIELHSGYGNGGFNTVTYGNPERVLNATNGVSYVMLRVPSGSNVSNVTVKPMIRLSTVSDATYAPYSNICPISGWDSATITDKDDLATPTQTNTYTHAFTDSQGNPLTVYGAEWDVVDGELKDMKVYLKLNGTENWTLRSQSNVNPRRFTMDISSLGAESLPSSGNTSSHFKYIMSATTSDAFGIFRNSDTLLVLPDSQSQFADVTALNTWLAQQDANGTPVEFVLKLATSQTIPQTPLTPRMLEGVNNIYADCGDIIDGEYFVDEGALDVRKVDYSIGSNTALKISDGRIIQGFANMAGYHSRPLDASGNWLDVDWSKDFEVCIAFKYTDSGASGITVLLGYNYSSTLNNRFQSPLIYIDKDHSRDLCLEISSNGSSWMVDQSLSYAISLDTWYALKLKFTLSTLTLDCSISTDFENWTSLYSNTLSAAPYHGNNSMIGIGGGCQASSWSSNGLLIDTFNTYIKGDGVNWGASSGVFPN